MSACLGPGTPVGAGGEGGGYGRDVMSRKLPMPYGNRGSFLALRLGAQMFPFTQERGAGMEALEASLGLKEGSPGLLATRVWLEGHQCQVRGRPMGPVAAAGGRRPFAQACGVKQIQQLPMNHFSWFMGS